MQSLSKHSVLLREGLQALNDDNPKQAANIGRRVLAVAPKNVEAHFLMGLIAARVNNFRVAMGAFKTVAKLDATHSATYVQMAKIYMRIGQMLRAKHMLDKAEEIGATDAGVQNMMGLMLTRLGDHKQASIWYRRAYDSAPDTAGFAVNLATSLSYFGRAEEAGILLSGVLATDEDNAEAQWLLSLLGKAQNGGRADMLLAKAEKITDMQATGVQTTDMQARARQSRAFTAYAAGKEFEDCSQWDKAFTAFEIGAKAKQSILEYDEISEQKMYAALTETFTAGWLDGAKSGTLDASPIFVLGQPRTGTTLIEQIISSHSDVTSAGELPQFGLSIRALSKVKDRTKLSADTVRASARIAPEKLGTAYLQAAQPMRGTTPRFVDKLPNNFLHIPLILKALPNARIVHLTRNPMDTCFANYKQLFAQAFPHSYDQAEMARHYIRYANLMIHWRTEFPGRFLDISYEDTVSDLEPNARKLIEFLGLDWQDACLNFHQNQEAVPTASMIQVREKIHTRSVGRWRKYERQLVVMRETLEAGGIEIL